MDNTWDCIIIGGGAAGLSAALVLGRARRRTLLVDAGRPSNSSASGIGGLLGHDRRPPAELYATGRAELATYPNVEVRVGEVVGAEAGFVVDLADGGRLSARRLLLATGMHYRTPQIPGLDSLWGTSVFHCPFCHGWEVRDQPVAVIAQGDRAVHSALLLRAWTNDIVVLSSGPSGLDGTQREQLAGAGIGLDERPIAELASHGGELTEVVFTDGDRLARRAALVATTLHQRSPLAAHLGVAFAPPNPLTTESLAIDAFHRTSVPGVFAAGDTAAGMPQVAAAIAAGSMAGAAIVQSLLAEDVGLPVPPWPNQSNQKENAGAHA